MLDLRRAFIENSEEYSKAASRLRLRELKLGPWHRFEFSLHGQAGKAAWDSHAKAVHDFRTPLEESFLQTGVIDPAAEYRESIKDGAHQPSNTFRRTRIKDGSLWASPHRYANRVEFYWRTVEAESARAVDLHLGFSEGCRVYLNGKEVFSQLVTPPREAAPNQASLTLDLKAGTNQLLVKLSSWRLHPSKHRTYFSFNPVAPLDLKHAALRLFADFPVQADWFMQDLDRLSAAPIGADLTREAVPKNLVRFCEGDRDTAFEEGLIRRVLSELVLCISDRLPDLGDARHSERSEESRSKAAPLRVARSLDSAPDNSCTSLVILSAAAAGGGVEGSRWHTGAGDPSTPLRSAQDDSRARHAHEPTGFALGVPRDDNRIARVDSTDSTPIEVKRLEEALAALLRDKDPVSDPAWLGLYAKACTARRLQRLEVMEAKSDRILFAKRKMLRPSFYGYTEGLSTANFEKNFEPGASLCLLTLKDGVSMVTELLHDEDGAFRDIDVSYDGKRILFAWKKNANVDDYHLYEMDWPSRKIRQLTHGIAVADFEGRYLPTGDIIFSSTRGIGTTDCWTTETSNMHACDKDGRRIRRLGYDQVVTCYPSVREDGTIIYTRWDYNDRGQVFPQPLFQMNPDGTGQTEFYGNNSWFPTAINHARPIPGTDKVLAVLHGHHTWQAGELAVIDRSKGTQETSGVQIIAPKREATGATRGYSYERDENGWIKPGHGPQCIAIDRYGQSGNLHRHPYPLDANSFVVAMTPYFNARDEGKQLGIRLHLYWMDVDGHRELLAYDPAVSSGHPIPLAPRKRPHVRPSVVNHAVPTGTYFMQDVYEGPGLEGVERGTVKKLRVVEIEYRALKVGSNASGGRGGGAMSSTPVSTGNGTWDVKRILGEARVYEDGSAMFKVPAHTPVYFQAIDKNGSMVQTMRSWSTLMPNESFGCVGCHEDKNSTPPSSRTSMAMLAGPQELTPFHGQTRGFSFLKEIQPMLDAKCISCHDGKADENGKVAMDLTDRSFQDNASKRRWTQSYLNLTHSKAQSKILGNADHPALNWVSAQSVPSMIPPYFRGSSQSTWFKRLREGHGEMTRKELDLFAAWIDLGVPFCGDYVEANAWSDYEFSHYLQMQRKRERLAAEDRESREALIEQATDRSVELPAPPPRYQHYAAARGLDIPARGRGYRNLALNPGGERGAYPKTTSNSVCRDLPAFDHANVIDGLTDNRGHGKRFPSWGPEKIEDPWIQIDLGQECEVDKLVITIRADFPHDSYWESGILEFSDGSRHPFTLKKKAAAQTISFAPRTTSSVRIAELKSAEEKWCALTEVEIWGRDVRQP